MEIVMRRFTRSLVMIAGSLAFTAGLPAAAWAKTEPVYTGLLDNVAVSGYDPVAYFTAGKPVKGDAKFKTSYKGAEFRFASAENLAKFKANPAAYAPQYGGYCAWAVSQGYTASGDPKVWKVVNGKLYLNYNAEVGERWSKNIPGHIKAADGNWPKLLAK
ncbi:YHS domain-containing protein [Sphingomonas sp. SFZ2018-12]|nr:YHS domain-containing protein [Sphingomonas sp. SFZ2018-12]